MRYGRKHVRTMCCRSFDAVSMVDATFTGFMVDIEVLEVVVKIDGAGAEITPEKGCVGCKDCCYVDVTFAAEWNGETCLPLVEMGNDCRVQLA